MVVVTVSRGYLLLIVRTVTFWGGGGRRFNIWPFRCRGYNLNCWALRSTEPTETKAEYQCHLRACRLRAKRKLNCRSRKRKVKNKQRSPNVDLSLWLVGSHVHGFDSDNLVCIGSLTSTQKRNRKKRERFLFFRIWFRRASDSAYDSHPFHS